MIKVHQREDELPVEIVSTGVVLLPALPLAVVLHPSVKRLLPVVPATEVDLVVRRIPNLPDVSEQNSPAGLIFFHVEPRRVLSLVVQQRHGSRVRRRSSSHDMRILKGVFAIASRLSARLIRGSRGSRTRMKSPFPGRRISNRSPGLASGRVTRRFSSARVVNMGGLSPFPACSGQVGVSSCGVRRAERGGADLKDPTGRNAHARVLLRTPSGMKMLDGGGAPRDLMARRLGAPVSDRHAAQRAATTYCPRAR